MPALYGLDLRKKVIEYVNKGNSCHRASIKFEMWAHFGMSLLVHYIQIDSSDEIKELEPRDDG
jgi:hypothetical protein